jgi:hypothetical protein
VLYKSEVFPSEPCDNLSGEMKKQRRGEESKLLKKGRKR